MNGTDGSKIVKARAKNSSLFQYSLYTDAENCSKTEVAMFYYRLRSQHRECPVIYAWRQSTAYEISFLSAEQITPRIVVQIGSTLNEALTKEGTISFGDFTSDRKYCIISCTLPHPKRVWILCFATLEWFSKWEADEVQTPSKRYFLLQRMLLIAHHVIQCVIRLQVFMNCLCKVTWPLKFSFSGFFLLLAIHHCHRRSRRSMKTRALYLCLKNSNFFFSYMSMGFRGGIFEMIIYDLLWFVLIH